jgi:hypothetical protein
MSLRATAGQRLQPASHELDGNRDSCGNLSTVVPAANIRIRCTPPVPSRLVSQPPVTAPRLAATLDPS